MLVVGLTGGIGCGKSHVSDLFHSNFNVPIIDADIIARELTKKDDVRKLIYEKMGSTFFDTNQELLRDKLRQAVFSDSAIRNKLENILHPIVFKIIDLKLKTIDNEYCIVVIPLLLETNRSEFVDRVLVVDCTVEEQIQRVMLRDQCSEAHVKSIIGTQINRQDRLKLADDVIENHNSIESLSEKVAILHKKYITISKQPIHCE